MKLHQPHEAAIVVPCFNEADRLDVNAFIEFACRNPSFQFLMVDDGSRDRTEQILTELCDAYPEHFKLLALNKNSGKAEAVRRGMLVAGQSPVAYFGFMDADLASPLDELHRIHDVLVRHSQINAVIGIRRRLLGHRVLRRPLRSWLGCRFSQVASWVLGLRIQDTQCGLKLFRKTPNTLALFAEPFTSRWIFDVEIFARLISAEGNVAAANQLYELPLESWREVPGSKLKSSDFLKALGELVGIYTTYLRGRQVDQVERTNPVSTLPKDQNRKAA